MFLKDFWYLSLVPVIIVAFLYLRYLPKEASMRFSSISLLKVFRPSLKTVLRRNLILVRVAALILMVVALSRPQKNA